MSLIQRIPWTQQPQVPVGVLQSFSAPLIAAYMPGLGLHNLAGSGALTVLGTAISASPKRITANGVFAEVHPSGGASGYGALALPVTAIADTQNELTIIWCGFVRNMSTANGYAFVRGRDGAGNGWSTHVRFTSATLLEFGIVTTSPSTVAYIASITDSFSDSPFEAIAWRHSGTTLTGFHGRSRKTGTVTTGSNLRSSTLGLRFGGNTATDVGGHSRPGMMLVFRGALSDAEIWGILANPWQIFRP